MKIIVTCDDMNPSVIPIWKQTWDKIKEAHPWLKITVFTVPLWKGRSDNDIFKNKEFKQWHKERKGWVEIAQQGYSGDYPPECLRFKKPQQALIRRGYRKITTYLPDDFYSFKAPFYRMDHNTIEILQDLGFSACVQHGRLILLNMMNKPMEEFIMIESHINIEEKNPDNIQLIHQKMDKYLSELEKKYQYVTIGELLKGGME